MIRALGVFVLLCALGGLTACRESPVAPDPRIPPTTGDPDLLMLIDWIFGSGHASLVWIVTGAAVLGWLLGIATCILFRYRTRKP